MPFIARRLRALREKHDLTQEQAASMLDVGYKYYQHVESGAKKQIWVDTVESMAAAYGLTLHEFFGPELPAGCRLKRKPIPSAHYGKSKKA